MCSGSEDSAECVVRGAEGNQGRRTQDAGGNPRLGDPSDKLRAGRAAILGLHRKGPGLKPLRYEI
jgi:hypothetical protein